MLVGARVAQGVFGALLAPAALSLLTVTFTDAAERAKAFAIFGAISGGGGAIGLILGGALTEYLSWRWCLYVNVPLAAHRRRRRRAAAQEAAARRGRQAGIDLPGTVVVVAGLVSFVYGLASAESNGWAQRHDPRSASPPASPCSPLFAVIESRVSDPLLPLHIVWDRNRGGSFLVVGVVGIGLFAVFLFLTYYVSLTLGYSPLKTGFAVRPDDPRHHGHRDRLRRARGPDRARGSRSSSACCSPPSAWCSSPSSTSTSTLRRRTSCPA